MGLTLVQVGEPGNVRPGCSDAKRPAEVLLPSVWDEASPDLLRLIRALGVDRSRAEDVLQDVYLTACQKAPTPCQRVELRRWLFRVTTNRCNLVHRRRARRRSLLRGLARLWRRSDHRGDTPDAAMHRDEQQLVRRALGRLEPQARSVLVLRYFAEFDSKEIGKILQLPDSTVRSRLRTARRQLASELKRAGYHHDQ